MAAAISDLSSMLFFSRTQAHVFHLKVKGPGSFAVHTALNDFYEGIVPLVDDLVQTYEGKYGIIDFVDVSGIDNDASISNIQTWIKALAGFVDTKRTDATLKDSWIQNKIDEIAELIYNTKYKLDNLA